MQSWNQVMDQAELHQHYVQFYRADEPLLNRNVGRYLWEGWLRGDALLVVATPQRQESLTGHLGRLGVDVATALSQNQLTLLDAENTLDLFMVNGQPDPNRFESVINNAVRMLKKQGQGARVRAYGEMVGVLWQAGKVEAAIRLEQQWDKIIQSLGITLFCGYPIDVFGNEMESEQIQEVIRAHTHLLPAGSDGQMNRAIHTAMDDVLGPGAEALRLTIKISFGASMPEAEATISWLRRNLPQQADEILSRARDLYAATISTRAA